MHFWVDDVSFTTDGEIDGGEAVIIDTSKWTQGQINDKANAGDTLLFEPGVHETIDIDNFTSTESNPLVLKSLDEDNPAIIRRDNNAGGQGIAIRKSSYVMVDNLIVDGALKGIRIEGSDHVIIRNSEVNQTGGSGIDVKLSSKHVDIIGNRIYDTGNIQPEYGEGIYVGTGGYSEKTTFPDNTEYVWIEGNEISDCGEGEAINIKGEAFYCTVRNNNVHDIVPGSKTNPQVNSGAIVIEAANNSLERNYRLDEKREIWVEDNKIENVSLGLKAHGIEVFGTGVYVLNNYISNTEEEAISLNKYENLGLPIYIFGNTYGAVPGGKLRISDSLDVRKRECKSNSV